MKKITLLFIGILISHYCPATFTPHFASTPSLSPDGETVYFSYDGDIWKVGIKGGEALRITALEGQETKPRVSPDGKWLAFTSNQYGNEDIFVMSLEKGTIRQLTFHQAKDEMESWSWDSKKIYFTSNRYNNFGSFEVPVEGGTARPLFTNYFNNANGLVESPDGNYIFTSSMESSSQISRKRYKGANNPDLLAYHPRLKSFKKLTTYIGKDFAPTVDRHGNIYYISDENTGAFNLYALKNGEKTALTAFKTSIKSPYVAANGESVIFEKDYQLYVYDVKTRQSRALSFTAPAQSRLEKAQAFQTHQQVTYFDVSPDGHKIAFVSRGVLFVSDIKGKFIQEVYKSKERISEVKWLKDNKTLLFNQTYNGYQNLFKISAVSPGDLKQITFDRRSNRDIHISTDHSKAVYLSGRDEVRILDLRTFESKTIVKDEIWAFQNSSPSFSPNGDYVLFTAMRNFEQDLFVHDIANNKTINLTQTGVSEINPSWSPDGKYIYFASNRVEPAYPFGMQNARIYRLALDWFSKDFKSDEYQKLFDIKDQHLEEEEARKKRKKKQKEELKKEQQSPLKINLDGITDRITLVSNNFGNQSYPKAYQVKDDIFVFYNSSEGQNKNIFYRSVFNDFKPAKHEQVHDKKVDLFIRRKDNFYFLSQKQIYTYSEDKNKAEKVDIKYSFSKNLASEFHQMFEETWAGIEENFYDADFHGIDWNLTREAYEAYLPFVKSRDDLRVLLNDMLGELNASHLGFYSQGREERKKLNYHTNETGIIFSRGNPYQVERIVRKSPAFEKGIDIKKGDILIRVNNQETDPGQDRDFYFTDPEAMEELHLVFNRGGQKVSAKIHPITNAAFKSLLYDEWIAENKRKVKELGKNRIAYSYMKNMTADQLESFLLDMVAAENDKDALILDLRFNTGGNVHDKVLNFLSQRPYLQWKYRGGTLTPQSNFSPSGKPIVLLINEASLSDAEMTAAGFKALKLGKIIGTETYRWIIFTSAKSLVDGSMFRVPAWGCFTLDGQNLELTGVSPDITVENSFDDWLNNRDPQLEKAVEEILKQI